MTEMSNEYMDTGALTEDAVPEPPSGEPSVEEPTDSGPEPYTEAPGSPSSDVVEHEAPPASDGSEGGSSGPDADLPKGAQIVGTPEDAEPKVEQQEGSEADLPQGAVIE